MNARAAETNRLRSTAGTGCAILFLLPFAVVGVGASWWTLASLGDYWRMQSWFETTATLIRVEAKHGDETIGVEATYRYEYAGKQYEGDRVAIHSGSDNIGSFQHRLLTELRAAHTNERPVPCFVNQSSPDEAVLNRDARPGLLVFQAIFALVFGGVGIGGMIGLWYYRGTEKAKSAEQQQHPDEPWKWRKEWADGVISSNKYAAIIPLFAFAALWNIISWPIAILFLFDDDPQEWFVYPLVAIFPLVGTILLAWMIFKTIRWQRFRHSYFRMASVPGVVGGRLAGVIVVPRRLDPPDGFHVRLACTRSESDGESTTQVAIWESEQLIGRTLESSEPNQTSIPVMFAIPSTAEATNELDLKWKLTCRAAIPGPDLELEYEVPVYRTPDSRDDVNVESDLDDNFLTEYAFTETLGETLAREKIRMERGHHSGEVVFCTPPARNLAACIGLTFFSTIWIGACVAMWWSEVWFFAIVFSLFGLAILFGTVTSWLSTSTLTIHDNRWQVRSGWWPLLLSRVEFTAADIESFTLNSNMTSGDKKWNDLGVKLRGRKKPVTLSKGLSSRRVEQIWIRDLKERAGLEAAIERNDKAVP